MIIHPITKDKKFDLIHVGKCGGSSAAKEISARGYQFNHIHLSKPTYSAERLYIIMARDPLSRFISAYNWRKRLYNQNAIKIPDEPAAKLRHETERSIFSIFPTVNVFAESLYNRPGMDISPSLTLMHMIGHATQGFGWYLSDLLEIIRPNQLLGVICQENFNIDMENLFGIKPWRQINANKLNDLEIRLSDLAKANLKKVLNDEYRTLEKLRLIYEMSGKNISVDFKI